MEEEKENHRINLENAYEKYKIEKAKIQNKE
jgi:hypothetical protein